MLVLGVRGSRLRGASVCQGAAARGNPKPAQGRKCASFSIVGGKSRATCQSYPRIVTLARIPVFSLSPGGRGSGRGGQINRAATQPVEFFTRLLARRS